MGRAPGGSRVQGESPTFIPPLGARRDLLRAQVVCEDGADVSDDVWRRVAVDQFGSDRPVDTLLCGSGLRPGPLALCRVRRTRRRTCPWPAGTQTRLNRRRSPQISSFASRHGT